VKNILHNERGNVMILVLIIAGVMGVTLSTLTVYSVNQSNYLNRVREAYQMMSITEALAKSASQSRNLARKKLQQLGIDPDQDALTISAQYTASTVPNKNDCDGANGAATMQQVNGLYYCLEGVAPYTVCVERPDSNALNPEMVCSDMQFTDSGINMNLDMDQLMDSQPGILSESAEMIASVFPRFNFNTKALSREINLNSGSPAKAMVAMLRDKTPEIKVTYDNLLYAASGGGSYGSLASAGYDSNGFYVLDDGMDLEGIKDAISHDTSVDPQVMSQLNFMFATLETRFGEIKSNNTGSVGANGYMVPSKESLERLKNLMEAIKAGPYKDAITGSSGSNGAPSGTPDPNWGSNKIDVAIGWLNGLIGHHSDSHTWDGYNPHELMSNVSWSEKQQYKAPGMIAAKTWAGKFEAKSNAYIVANGVPSAPDPTVLNADSNYSEAISPTFVAELVPCSVINRCVNVQAESNRAAELRGKRYLQNVFVE
jgi:hypothetical protein